MTGARRDGGSYTPVALLTLLGLTAGYSLRKRRLR